MEPEGSTCGAYQGVALRGYSIKGGLEGAQEMVQDKLHVVSSDSVSNTRITDKAGRLA